MSTKTIATWTSSLTYTTLPTPTIHAIRSFYNWTGCTIAGSTHPATSIAHNALAPFFGAPTSTLLGLEDGKTDAQHAALINGIASHVHDYDDTHLETIIHPTDPVAAAVLGIAEALQRPVSGEDLITAPVAGVEVECKLGLAVWPSHYDVGCNPTIGLREMFGSYTKSFHSGRAAQNGLMAAILAKNGYTSSLEALEAKRAWVNVVSDIDSDDDKLKEQAGRLGRSGCCEIVKNSFKLFPCGIVIHPVIDGCIRLHGRVRHLGSSIQDIRDVQIIVHPLVLELTGKTKPNDGLEAKFSVYHGAAIGLVLGKATPSQYEDSIVQAPEIINLRGRIHATADEKCRTDECHIVVNFNDGISVKTHVDHAVGSVEAPMSDAQLTDKFLDQCVPVLGMERAKMVSEWCWALDQHEDIRRIKDIF